MGLRGAGSSVFGLGVEGLLRGRGRHLRVVEVGWGKLLRLGLRKPRRVVRWCVRRRRVRRRTQCARWRLLQGRGLVHCKSRCLRRLEGRRSVLGRRTGGRSSGWRRRHHARQEGGRGDLHPRREARRHSGVHSGSKGGRVDLVLLQDRSRLILVLLVGLVMLVLGLLLWIGLVLVVKLLGLGRR